MAFAALFPEARLSSSCGRTFQWVNARAHQQLERTAKEVRKNIVFLVVGLNSPIGPRAFRFIWSLNRLTSLATAKCIRTGWFP